MLSHKSPAQQSFISYAVFEKNSKFANYDLGQEETEDRCRMAGIDLTTLAEKELKDETEDGVAKRRPSQN